MRNRFLRGVLTACLFAAGFAPAVTAATQSDVISEGVYIGDQNVGGMTAEEDKKTPARVGRVPGLILAQTWGRPSLAGGVLPYLPAARQQMAVVARILGKRASVFM